MLRRNPDVVALALIVVALAGSPDRRRAPEPYQIRPAIMVHQATRDVVTAIREALDCWLR